MTGISRFLVSSYPRWTLAGSQLRTGSRMNVPALLEARPASRSAGGTPARPPGFCSLKLQNGGGSGCSPERAWALIQALVAQLSKHCLGSKRKQACHNVTIGFKNLW